MQSFANGSGSKRSISIKVDKEFICFYFDDQLRDFYQHKEWVKNEGIYEDEPEKEPTYFYWIGTYEWINNRDHWVRHMEDKWWFTTPMRKYIDQQAKAETPDEELNENLISDCCKS